MWFRSTDVTPLRTENMVDALGLLGKTEMEQDIINDTFTPLMR